MNRAFYDYEVVMGLEVHAELATKSKIFCACSTEFGGKPNSNVCPVCSGMPGVLPKFNRLVAEYAVKLGLALDCDITRHCKFDRKNYFYPDLPKAYQISQLYAPICRDGHLEIEVEGQKKSIGIREIHMEEDAGKLIHDNINKNTLMDFNRCGVPLLEIVSQPDFRSGGEVLAYLEKLREILLYLGICDCKMQEGSIRADVNLSVHKKGEALGVRTEMKNLNSFKAIGRAIEYESARQIEILEKGGEITQETRRWDDDKGESYAMRDKENAQDYRYFPEPDLLPIEIDDNWFEEIKKGIPELAAQKRERYMREYALSEAAVKLITQHKNIADLFEEIAKISGEATEAAHLIGGIIMSLMNNNAIAVEDLHIDGGKLAFLIELVCQGKINRNSYKECVTAVFEKDVDPKAYIDEKGLLMLCDETLVADIVDAVLSENTEAVADYHAGKEKAFGFLMGQAIKKLGKSANPEAVKRVLGERV